MHSTLSTAERRPGWLGGGATTTRCGIRRSDGFIAAILKSDLVWIFDPKRLRVNRSGATWHAVKKPDYATIRCLA